MNLKEKLNIIQTKLKVEKSQFNPFGKFAFRNSEDILSAVKQYLAETKTILLTPVKPTVVGEWHYMECTATLLDCESDESISVCASAREEVDKKGMDGSQISGSSSSYAKKYALCDLFAIDDEKDSDTTNTGNVTKKLASETQVKTIKTLYDEANIVNILKHYEVENLEGLTIEQASEVIKHKKANDGK